MITKQNNEIFSTEDKYVHIIGTDNYFKRGLAIGLSVEQCEEVETIPNIIDDTEYGNQVNELIRAKYSLSEELSLLRQRDSKQEEYQKYNAYCEECKKIIKDKMNEGETSN